MARSRNLKPGFFKNEKLAECAPFARLLFAGLWCLADREGRLEDRPKRIRAEILPYDEGSIDEMLSELQKAGFIERYEAGGQGYIQVVNFGKHQTPHHKEPVSLIPALDKSGANPRQAQVLPKSSRADSLNLIPDSLNPSTTKSPAGDWLVCPVEKIVDAYHRLMPDNPICKALNKARRGAITERWKEAAKLTCEPFGYADQQTGLTAWEQFFKVCATSDFLTGKVKPPPDKPRFFADIDFLMSPSGFIKSLENKYHREAA